jgi:uncharacterized protein (TIGR02284 family)
MSNKEIVTTLNDLVETCKDGEFGFGTCARHAESPELRNLFTQRAAQCERDANELQTYVVQYGGTPDTAGSAGGALHRGWLAVRGSLLGYSDLALLEECERGEDNGLSHYRKALGGVGLPQALRAVIERQCLGVQRNHEQVKALQQERRLAG